MKELLQGNEAVARGLYEAGVRVVSSYPGTPSTEITEAAAAYDEIYCEWAPNEKVAAEVAAGAAIGGARSFCGMKHVGMNVAADPVFTMSYIGVNAGMVIGVADVYKRQTVLRVADSVVLFSGGRIQADGHHIDQPAHFRGGIAPGDAVCQTVGVHAQCIIAHGLSLIHI